MKFKGNDVRILIDARKLAKEHGLYIIEKHDCLLLYRNDPESPRGAFVGRRTTTAAMLALVKRASATTPTATHTTEHYAE